MPHIIYSDLAEGLSTTVHSYILEFCYDYIRDSHIANSFISVLYTNIHQKLVNKLRRLLNCEIGGLDCRVITTEYRTRVHFIHMYHLFCNAMVHVIYSVVSGQHSYTIHTKCSTVTTCTQCFIYIHTAAI